MTVMTKPLIANFKDIKIPCYSFLISHPSGRRIVFDLGIRKDWENYPSGLVDRIKSRGYTVEADTDVASVLVENGVSLEEVEAVVWSHYHFDHTGDPATFPSTTKLIVGPGVASRFPVAWPTNPDAAVDEKAWSGRERQEISFSDSKLKIGRFRAVDYFGDGSFYLLDTPGHLLGHMCGLARTTADSFILMGGDAAHHAGEFRPSEYIPLPISISITDAPRGFPCPCPGDLLVEHIHPEHSATKPFYRAADGFNEVDEEAEWSIDGLAEFDADERVLAVIAHDASLLPVLDFLPKTANEWKSKEWRSEGQWRFVSDFAQGVQEAQGGGKL
jgi:glyoxylase-like metal-dependent hydrolase (beta-lactamase superfamily II)